MRPTRVRLLVVLLATLMAVLLYLHRFCLSFAERYIKEDLHLSNDQTAWLLSAFFWAYALAQVPAGSLSDRRGARAMLALYILLWSLCTGLVGAATIFAVILSLRFACGLAQAGAYPTSAALLTDWVPFRRRGLASGIISYGGRVGGAIAPALTAYLMVAFAPDGASPLFGSGWRPVLLVYGAAGVLFAGLFWLCFRNRPAQHPLCNAEEVRLIETDRPPAAPGPTTGLLLGPIVRSPSLWLCSAAQFCTNLGWVFVLTWLPRYLWEVHRVPILERGWMAAVPVLVGMQGQLAGGWLTDALTGALGVRWGRGLPMALTRFVAMAAFALCVGLSSPWAVTAALGLMALATDLGTPSVWAYCQDVGGRHVGAVVGWGNMWGNVGAALSPLLLNAVIVRWGWPPVFLAGAAAFLLAGVAALGVDATVPLFAPDEKRPERLDRYAIRQK